MASDHSVAARTPPPPPARVFSPPPRFTPPPGYKGGFFSGGKLVWIPPGFSEVKVNGKVTTTPASSVFT